MVTDLGGTFDVSILEIDDGVVEGVGHRLSSNRLGGDDFDQCIMKYLVSEFKRATASTSAATRWPYGAWKEYGERPRSSCPA